MSRSFGSCSLCGFFGGKQQNKPDRFDEPNRSAPRSEPKFLNVETVFPVCESVALSPLRLSHMRWDPQPQPLQILPAELHNYRIAHKLHLLLDRNNYESNEMGLEV
jgi:hypothetical protein